MVKVILQSGLRELRGKMGDWTYRRMYGKQTIMKTPDMSRVKWSKAQKASRERFREAIHYAKQAMADPKVRAQYEKAGKKAGRQPFRMAVSDFFEGKNLLK
jgi:DnaJ-class molecular chaperone